MYFYANPLAFFAVMAYNTSVIAKNRAQGPA